MKDIARIFAHCTWQSVRHPRTPINGNPIPKPQRPAPWWGSLIVLVIGIVSWCISAICGINGLDEAGRAMVYLPLGNLFGMSMRIYQS